MVRNYDPLACIPPANVVREHLDRMNRAANRLRILLHVCEAIENSPAIDPEEFAQLLQTNAAPCEEEVAHA